MFYFTVLNKKQLPPFTIARSSSDAMIKRKIDYIVVKE